MKTLALLLFLPPLILAIWGARRGMEGLERRLIHWMAIHALFGVYSIATELLHWVRLNQGAIPLYVMANAFFGFRALTACGGSYRTLARWMMGLMPVIGALGWVLPSGSQFTQPMVLLGFVLVAGLVLHPLTKAESPILADARFWFANGVLIGQGAGLLPWLTFPSLWRSGISPLPLWTIHNLAQLVGYALFAGVYLCKR